MKYLHSVGPTCKYLDHRIIPEIRAMLAAMVSRLPAGGITQRYAEVVAAVAKDTPQGQDPEDRLTTYPMPESVQAFFDEFVGRFGHSSILELVGSPTIFTEGVSWLTCWMLFDSPLCAGQEFSTRALRHKDWPMARECTTIVSMRREVFVSDRDVNGKPTQLSPGLTYTEWGQDPTLKALHEDWLCVYDAEVEWWKAHLSVKKNRDALGIGDKEPFRPALDRARWALPGTIATGCVHTSHLRERIRTLKDGASVFEHTGREVWGELFQAYDKALPGMSGLGGREAVYGSNPDVPKHVRTFLDPVDAPTNMVDVQVTVVNYPDVPHKKRPRTYADPELNHAVRVDLSLNCSLAVARDWHRHRTMFPWSCHVVMHEGQIRLDPHYEPMSDYAKAHTPDLLRRSSQVYEAVRPIDRHWAALALPLGTQVRLGASGGLRDVLYVLELRRDSHGANFEYKDQATVALSELAEALPTRLRTHLLG